MKPPVSSSAVNEARATPTNPAITTAHLTWFPALPARRDTTAGINGRRPCGT